jgi:tetraacyldisaccharide 4'-kinase
MKPSGLFLLPFALLYGLVVAIRNLLYDIGIFSSQTFEKSVISVGNLTAGGTGKSPHIEYLLALLLPVSKAATLSRGYGRKTSGFLFVSEKDNYEKTGDEPLQFKKKFTAALVAVDENRKRGIYRILKEHPETEVVLLDDAFQHRSVKPGLNILLTDFSKLYTDDFLLPSGMLREWPSAMKRADIIIVTKTPEIFSFRKAIFD